MRCSPLVSSDRSALSTARARWVVLLLFAGAVFWLVYAVAVQTVTGQRLENAALRGAEGVDAGELVDADDMLGQITVTSLAVAIVAIALIGFARGGWRLAAYGAGTIVVSLGATEVFKHLLPRPDLIGAPSWIAHNSFPSGHTTVAMSVLMAVLIVVPWRWRGLAMIIVMTWAVGIGAYTVTAGWHRVSDTVGADAVVLMVGALASLLLLGSGAVRPVSEPARLIRVFFVCLAVAVLIVGAVVGTLLAVYASRQPLDQIVTDDNLFLAAQALASFGSLAAALLAWGSWHRLESVAPAERGPIR